MRRRLSLYLGLPLLLALAFLAAGQVAGGPTSAQAAGPPAHINLSVTPTAQMCYGPVVLVAYVTDVWGYPVADGTAVAFSSSAGYLTTSYTYQGRAYATLIPVWGGYVTATAGGVAATTSVPWPAYCPTQPGYVPPYIGYVPPYWYGSIYAPQFYFGGGLGVRHTVSCGAQATIYFYITNAYGYSVADGTQITFTSPNGAITPNALTYGGTAVASFVAAPGFSGAAQVTVGMGGARQTIAIDCGEKAGPPARLGISIPQDSVSCGSQASIIVTATDAFGNPVGDGTVVKYQAALGTIIPSAETRSGRATSIFTSTPGASGTALITVASDGVTSQAMLPVTCQR